MNNRNLFQEIAFQFKSGSMTVRLLFINIAIFVLIGLSETLCRLLFPEYENVVDSFMVNIFSLSNQLGDFLFHPWGLVTSIFAHFELMHLISNMLFLYLSGLIFESFFGKEKMFYLYLLGGICGGLAEIAAHLIFPTLSSNSSFVVGASGSIMAIFGAMAFYRPNTTIQLFGLFPVRLLYVAAFFILSDLLSLGKNDHTAHFAHLGGVAVGFMFAKNPNGTNIVAMFENFLKNITRFFRSLFQPGSTLKASKGGNTRSAQFKTDEQYNLEKKQRQEKIDAILDKISKSGYDSLTKEEKSFLFDQSKNG